MGSLLVSLRGWWETADRTQKVVTLFGSVFLLVLIGGTVFFASRPRFDLLYGGLAPADQGMVMEGLQQLGIPAQFDRQGNILVPSDKVAEARAQLAKANKLPASGGASYGDLANLGMMNTPSVERERLKVILEGELARSIETFEGVGSARVHITMGDDSPFEAEKKPATASVGLTEAGSGLNRETGLAIARLVASAVPGLQSENVSVMTSRGMMLFDGKTEADTAGRADHKIQAELQESKRRQRELQQALDLAFGPGNTAAMISVEMDFNRENVDSTEVLPTEEPLSEESNTESYGGAGAGVGGSSSGLSNNLGGPSPLAGGPSGAGDEYTGKQEAKTYGNTTKRTVTDKSAGTLIGMTVNVLADEAKIKDPAKLNDFIRGYMGPKADVDGFSFAVTSVPFDRTVEQAAAKAAASQVSGQKMQQYMALLPVLALVAVGFMVIRAIAKAAKTSSNVVVSALPNGRGYLPAPAGGAPAQVPGYYASDGRFVPGTPPQGIQAALGPAGGGGLQFIDTGPGVEPIETIAAKVNVPLEQIKKMSQDRPDAVAMLLKSWLVEDRR